MILHPLTAERSNAMNSLNSIVEPTVSQPSPTLSSAPAPAAKGKAGAKKRPQLTRKQSNISAESADGKQQQGSSLAKMPESGPASSQQQSDSDFDISSSH